MLILNTYLHKLILKFIRNIDVFGDFDDANFVYVCLLIFWPILVVIILLCKRSSIPLFCTPKK